MPLFICFLDMAEKTVVNNKSAKVITVIRTPLSLIITVGQIPILGKKTLKYIESSWENDLQNNSPHFRELK